MSSSCSRDCASSPAVSGLTPSKRYALVRIWTVPACRCCSRTWWTSRWCNSSTRIFPAIDSWRLCATMAATAWAKLSATWSGLDTQLGTSKSPNDVVDLWRDPMKRSRSRCSTATSTICGLHICGPSNILTSTRRYAWSPGSGSIRSGACMPRSRSGPMLAIALPEASAHDRYPVAVGVAAYGRFVRGDLEGAIELGERAVAAADRLAIDGSGLAERALGNAWFYRGDTERGVEWMDRMIASARRGSPARLAHALYMRSVAFTSVGDNVSGAQFASDCLTAAAESGSPTALAQAHYAQGLALKSTSPVEATAELQRAADVARDAGNRWIQAFALTEVLWLEAHQGRPREALARYIDVIDLWYRGGDWASQWLSLRHVFGILVQLRADLGAATLHGALTAAGSAYALPFEAADAQRIGVLVDNLRDRLGAAAFASAVRRGTTLSDGEIIDFVRAQIHALS